MGIRQRAFSRRLFLARGAWGSLAGWASLAVVGGCRQAEVPATQASFLPPDDEQLRVALDEVLEYTFAHRHLNLRDHAAWQILHGALAFQRDFLVEKDGRRVSAVDYVLAGGHMKGWTVEPVIDVETGHRGLRAILEVGSKSGQGHADQWLAVLAQCDLPADQPILVAGERLTMADYVAQVQLDVPRNFQREYSWTLIGLTTYLPTDAQWTASDGNTWTVAKLVEIEALGGREAVRVGQDQPGYGTDSPLLTNLDRLRLGRSHRLGNPLLLLPAS